MDSIQRNDPATNSAQTTKPTPTIEEGVIQYTLHHLEGKIPHEDRLENLIAWRAILFDLGLIGQDPLRYQGLGFGNVSLRTDSTQFFLSGSQTGQERLLENHQFARIIRCDIAQNQVWSEGPILPSSEAMTHAAAYEAHPSIQCVLHVHHPGLWNDAHALGLAITPIEVGYGTVAMAAEVRRILENHTRQLIAMGGHQDGIIVTGLSPADATQCLLNGLALSHERQLHRAKAS